MKRFVLITVLLIAAIFTGCSESEFDKDTNEVMSYLSDSMKTGNYDMSINKRLELYYEEWGKQKADQLNEKQTHAVTLVQGIQATALLYSSEQDEAKRTDYRKSFLQFEEDIRNIVSK